MSKDGADDSQKKKLKGPFKLGLQLYSTSVAANFEEAFWWYLIRTLKANCECPTILLVRLF